MSLLDSSISGIKGKRIPGRPGRFDPSEPLHMTTRRAAKTTTTNGSPSINGSVDDDDSRRGSLDDSRPITSHSNDSQFSVKSRRPSDVSLTNASPDVTTNGLSFLEEQTSESAFTPSMPVLHTPSPGRKRKRSASPQPSHLVEPLPSLDTLLTPNLGDRAEADPTVEHRDAADLVARDELSEREGSADSSKSDERNQLPPFDVQSMDVTPIQSNGATPPSRESDDYEEGIVKPLGASPEDIAMTEQDEPADAVEEMDVDVEVEAPDEGDEPDGQIRWDDDERPVRRFGGRRRAQHPIPRVEKAMQRQAELKSAYRAIARAQKQVLAEIAQRTVDDLNSNPDLYTQSAEHAGVQEGIENALAERRDRLHAQVQWTMDQLRETLECQREALRAKCIQQLQELKEERLAQLEHQMLRIVREAQRKRVDVGYETEDEDDVIPKPKRVCYGFKRPSVALEDVYHSRSREFMETVRASNEFEARYEMRKLLNEYKDDEQALVPGTFTIMDETPRHAADMRRQASVNMDTLAKAAREVVKTTKELPPIRNEDAHGLQLLGDLASRPSLTASGRSSTRSKSNTGPAPRRASARPMQPQLQISTNYQHSPIQLEMSPRTTQALGDRFEGSSMLPPMTPRRRGMSSLMHSPENSRAESTLQSPANSFSLFNNSQPPPATAPDMRPGSGLRGHLLDLGRDRPPVEIRPQSEHRPEAHFPPAQSNERLAGFPLWRDYSREPTPTLHRRSSSQHERPQHDFGVRLPGQGKGPLEAGRLMQDALKVQESDKEKPLPFGQMNSRPLLWQDRSSQPGAADMRDPWENDFRRKGMKLESVQNPQRSKMQSTDANPPPTLRDQWENDFRRRGMKLDDLSNPQRSEGPSSDAKPPSSAGMTFVQDFRSRGLPLDDGANRQRSKGSISGFKQKTNKEERDGLSRRSWSNQRKLSQSLGATGNADSPPLAPAPAATAAGSPVPHPPVPWHAPSQSQHSPPVPPPTAPYQQSPYSQPPPPPPNYRATQPSHENFANRSTFPPRPASSTSYDRLPPTPLYVMPPQKQQAPPQPQQQHQPQQQQAQQQQQAASNHPPPPGVPPEQYNRPFNPPPPPGYQAPPPPPPPQLPSQQQQQQTTPQSPYAQSASASSYTSQFGGPPLAPAGANAYHPPGFRPAPAFAQQAQQQQQQGGTGGRRRTQSDASQFAKFQPWNPPVGKR